MQIDRVRVKQHAKEIIRTSRPSMILVGALYSALAALTGYLSLRLTGIDMNTANAILSAAEQGSTERAASLLIRAMPGGGETFMSMLLQLVLSIVAVGFVIFTLNTIRRNGPVIGNLLDGFSMMPRLLFLLLLQYVLISLWSLLLFIPGVIATYRYSLAVYIMIDHPEMSAVDCLRESKRMTMGYKWQLFMLDLSFILWQMLCALPLIGYLVQVYVTPYTETAKALYYEELRRPVDTVYV